MYNSIVLHIPHSAIGGLNDAVYSDRRLLFEQVHYLTDWYTDYLFDQHRPDMVAVQSIYSRFVVDCERLINDPLESRGQGILYTRLIGSTRTISEDERTRLMAYYTQHIDRLRNAVKPGSLLIDCHSFPSDIADVDICIGYNEDWSKPNAETLKVVRDVFTRAGYSIAENQPYSNSVSPKASFAYPSLMIEVNKRCYMDEETLRLTPNCDVLRRTISELYTMLLND
jgi:N-formylglutamate amidohydrolase